LILLTVIVAMGAAWWVDHRKLSKENRQLDSSFQVVQKVNRDLQAEMFQRKPGGQNGELEPRPLK